MELTSTRWAEVFRAALMDRFYKTLSLDTASMASSIGTSNIARDEAQIVQWLSEQIEKLRRESESDAAYSALCIMTVAFEGRAVLVPGLVEALIERLSGSEPMSVAAAWALVAYDLSVCIL
jgi:hypothetical protein